MTWQEWFSRYDWLILFTAIFAAGFAGSLATIIGTRRTARLTGENHDSTKALFEDLWSTEIHRRLSALFSIDRLARSGAGAAAVPDALIAFARHRLGTNSATSEREEGFDDVRLALTILGSMPCRKLQKQMGGRSIDLARLDFRHVPLTGMDLHGFRLFCCNFRNGQLSGANLSGCDLAGAMLAGADLRKADLKNADLSDADLSNVDLSGACVQGANLAGANLASAILIAAKGLTQEQLDNVFGDAATATPEHLRLVLLKPKPVGA